MLSCPNLETLHFVLDHSPVTVVSVSLLGMESDFPPGLYNLLAQHDRVRCAVTQCTFGGLASALDIVVFAGRSPVGKATAGSLADQLIRSIDRDQAKGHETNMRVAVLGLVNRALQGLGAPPPPFAASNDPFAVLGLTPGVSFDDVKAAHKRIVAEVHPDGLTQRPTVARLAEEHLKRVNRAYEEIKRQQSP